MRLHLVSGSVLLAAAVACGSQSPATNSGGNGGIVGTTSPPDGAGRPDASASTPTTPTTPGNPGTSDASSSSQSDASSATARGDASQTGPVAQPPAKPLPALHVEGNRIVDANGQTVVLRGIAVPDIGELFALTGDISGITNRIDEILDAATLPAHAIRLPVYPRTVVNGGSPSYSPAPYPVGAAAPAEAGVKTELSASDYIAQILKPAVDFAVSKGLYVIVDYHQIDNVTTGTSSADAVTFWTTVAPVFAAYSNVIYEAFNEPIDNRANAGITAAGAWTPAFIAAAQSWIQTIRAGAPDNVIIVGSPTWSQYPDGALAAGLTGGNLAFTAHIYPGNWPGSVNGFQNRVAAAAMSEPVVITEWGYQIGAASARNNLLTPDDTWAQNLRTFVESGGESWTAWVADPYWGPPMFARPTGTDQNAFNGLNDFGNFVQAWLGGSSSAGDGGTEQ